MCVSCAADSDTAVTFGFAATWQAYLACRRGKRGTGNAQRYELQLLDRIVDTVTALRSRCYVPSRSLCFVVKKPKAREIHAADFSDRVVHHLLVPRLERLFEPAFIHDIYSNRKGKGTHAAVAQLGHFMRSLEGQGKGVVYALQLDVRNFFNSIDRPTLQALVERRLDKAVCSGALPGSEAADLRWLVRRLLQSDPAENVIHRGHPETFAQVPQYKRLANAPEGKGLPIGNLTSQFFANVYLNELDQFVKHRLKCRHYLRYVDDFVLLHHDPQQLLAWRADIARYLHERLELKLKELSEPHPVGDGVDFLGYIIRPHYRLVRRRVVGNLRERLQVFEKQLLRAEGGGVTLLLKREVREGLRATLASYLGHFRHANAMRLTRALWQRHPWLMPVFKLLSGYHLQPLWEPASVTSLRSQWHYFKQHHPESINLMQVGNRVEAFNADADKLLSVLDIHLAHKPRHRFDATLSLPLNQLNSLRQKLWQMRIPHLFVAEEGYMRGGMKRRVLRWHWWPQCNDLVQRF
jgi:RNA-directed DNA polymerase